MIDRGYLHDHPLIKTPAAESVMGFPRQKHHTRVAAFLLLGEECALTDMEGRKQKEARTRFLQILLMSFTPLDLAVYPCYIA